MLGHGGKADPLLATLANGTAGVALEVDEGNRLGGGHPAIHVIPAALAVAEELGADGGGFSRASSQATKSARASAAPPAAAQRALARHVGHHRHRGRGGQLAGLDAAAVRA